MAGDGLREGKKDLKGVVFDIQRASMLDGPGIRTTVFLKGCPLLCLWCHNPEAKNFDPQLFFYFEKCVLCGCCVEACDHGVHRIFEGVHQIDFEKCDLCGRCIDACDHKALKIIGREMTVADIMQEVLADLIFYERSGGGLTLSGGEPMSQVDFSFAILQAAKNERIHTCIETSGCGSQTLYERILPVTDLFLFDYKVTGRREYKKYTGVYDDLIRSNLDFIYRQHKPVILRCPIIPGINDTELHFHGIAELGKRYPDLIGIEILPYHDMGNSKRTGIGSAPTLVGLKTTPLELANEWINTLHRIGCTKAQIG